MPTRKKKLPKSDEQPTPGVFCATIVEFDYEADTGDECKGVRIEKRTDRGVLFEGPVGTRNVLFLRHRWHRDQGEFFALTGKNSSGGRYPKAPEIAYHPGSYDLCPTPETDLREIRKLETMGDQAIKFVLQIPTHRSTRAKTTTDCLAALG